MAADREPSESSAALAALGSAALMIAQQVGSKATRDALFLSSFAPEDLPQVVIAAAGAAMIAVFAASRAYARFGPARVVPLAFAASAALYAAEWGVSDAAPRAVAVVLFLHTSIFGALVISGFWSVVNERFDPHTAKRVVSRIGVGATVGGVAGGVLAERIGAWGEADTMLAALAGINALAALGVRRVSADGAPRPSEEAGGDTWGFAVLRRAPYLRGLAGLVLLTAVSAGLLDYAFKAEAARVLEPSALLSFFALFHTAAAVLSLLVQSTLARSALARLGVAGSAAMLPLTVLVTAGLATVIPRLTTIVIARAGELVVANSVFRSGYELLYTPVSLGEKRPTKALIDVAGNRLGDALGSAVTLVVLALAPLLAIPLVLGLAAATAAASLVLARRLHRGYLGELEDTLRSGAPEGAEIDLLRAATLQTLSTLGLDREALFEQLAAHQSWSEPARDEEAATTARVEIQAPDDDPIHAAVETIRRGDAERVREVLDGELDERLVPYVIALLARRDVYHDAIAALRRVAERSVALLAKALTDSEQPFAIRRRLPRVLEVCESEAAAEALARGLDDEKFEVRYRAALALARITARVPALRPNIERVHDVVRAELEAGRKVWDRRRLLDEDEEDAPLLDRALRDRIHRSVEHVFTLLSLAYDAEPLRLSLIALAGDDRTLRGTALEYLESVLPEPIHAALFPMLDARVEVRKKRSRQEIVDELVRSMQSMDARALQAAIDRRSGS